MSSSPPISADTTGSDRSQWPVRKGRLQELECGEPDLSATTTVEERFAMMWQLAQDAWAFLGEPIDPDSCRKYARVIRRSVSNESKESSARVS